MQKGLRFTAFVLMAAFMFGGTPSQALAAATQKEIDDAMSTLQALNMATVSFYRILKTQDSTVLEQEYNNILNYIDYKKELTDFRDKIMDFITQKGIKQEYTKLLQERYDKAERQKIIKALSNIRVGGNPLEICTNLAASCVSAYLSYQASADQLRYDMDENLWKLNTKEKEEINELWKQLTKHRDNLPNSSRLDKDDLDFFFKALQKPDAELRYNDFLHAEQRFRYYPPYWVYRAWAARELSNAADVRKCLDEFDKVWRRVLSKDPYKVEAAKMRIQSLTKTGMLSEQDKQKIQFQLEEIQNYMPLDDLANNFFMGVTYFALGDIEKARRYISAGKLNGTKISNTMLEQFKTGSLDLSALQLSDDEKPSVQVVKPQPMTEQSETKDETAAQETEHEEKQGSSYLKYIIGGAVLLLLVVVVYKRGRCKREEGIRRKVKELNSTCSGQYLGDRFTKAQIAAIRSGKFDGMGLGDYWTIDNVNWRIADFDYLIRSDRAKVNPSQHHVMILPDQILYQARMNEKNTNSYGYAGSEMRKSGIKKAETMIADAFGREHIMTYSGYIENKKAGGILTDCSVELMTQGMVWGDSDNQLSIFNFIINKGSNGWYWLQDAWFDNYFADVSLDGSAYYSNASFPGGGVRPVFALH